MEKVEISMLNFNKGAKKLDPVQTYYASLITSVRDLCLNPKIFEILLMKPIEINVFEETPALKILR